MNLNGQFYQNNAEFVTSRWTEGTGNIVNSNIKDIYRSSAVGINNSNPQYTLHVGGSVQIEGNTFSSGLIDQTLYANGDRQWIDRYGMIKVSRLVLSDTVKIPANTIGYSVGEEITVASGATLEVSDGSTFILIA